MCDTDRKSGGYDLPGGADFERSRSDRGRRYQEQYQASESF